MEEQKRFHRWRPHPWHGLSEGRRPPVLVNAYIEITPFDGVKYEIDKETGYLKVDRPQLTSSLPPALYGFIPRTFCGPHVTALSRKAKRGDGDPLDICVLSERPIQKSEVVVPARVVGGLRIIDGGEADDKIIAVLDSDPYWTHAKSIEDLPQVLRERLVHYFMTYKLTQRKKSPIRLDREYGLAHAKEVIQASLLDYRERFAAALI